MSQTTSKSKELKDRKTTRDAEGNILKKTVTRRTAKGTRKETVYVARVRRNEYDEAGNFVRLHERKAQVGSFNEAVIRRRQLRQQLDAEVKAKKRPRRSQGDKFFNDLLDFYELNYVKEAVFANGKKIAGQKNPIRNTKRMLADYREFFENPKCDEIDYNMCFDYKIHLVATPYHRRTKVKLAADETFDGEIVTRHRQRFGIVIQEKQRKPATVHRYLSTLRTIFSKGVQHGYLPANPFLQGDPLIEPSIEDVRDRICSFEEEEAIFRQCVPPREHLRHIVTIAIDSFVRENEMFSLLGSDVDFENRCIMVREMNAKTEKTRYVPMSDRAYESFVWLRGTRSKDEWRTSRVFEIKNVGRTWYTALQKAGIEDLRFHDLRGTGITRMLDAGVPEVLVMKFSGHDKYETFKKYVKRDLGIIKDAAAAMSDLFRHRRDAKGLESPSLGLDSPSSGSPTVVLETDSVN